MAERPEWFSYKNANAADFVVYIWKVSFPTQISGHSELIHAQPSLRKHWGRDKWPPFSRRLFRMDFLEWKCMNFDWMSLKLVPNGAINNIPALVQIMARRRPSDKPLSEPMLVYWRIYASLGLNELMILLMIRNSTSFSMYLLQHYILRS